MDELMCMSCDDTAHLEEDWKSKFKCACTGKAKIQFDYGSKMPAVTLEDHLHGTNIHHNQCEDQNDADSDGQRTPR